MALTKDVSIVDAVGAAMASAATIVGADANIADAYEAQLYVYHAVATTTAHTASTQPSARIEVSPDATIDDAWTTFVELSFSTTSALSTTLNGQINAGSTTAVLTAGTNFPRSTLAFIVNSTPADSEWVEVAQLATNTATLADGVTKTQATGLTILTQAERRTVLLPFGAKRVRVVYYGATGPTSVFQTKLLKVTAI